MKGSTERVKGWISKDRVKKKSVTTKSEESITTNIQSEESITTKIQSEEYVTTE